jgi:hypothetical protein
MDATGEKLLPHHGMARVSLTEQRPAPLADQIYKCQLASSQQNQEYRPTQRSRRLKRIGSSKILAIEWFQIKTRQNRKRERYLCAALTVEIKNGRLPDRV